MPIPELATGTSPTPSAVDCFDSLEVAHSRGAIMDVVAYCAHGSEFLVGFSICDLLTTRYAMHACSKRGHAAGRGE